MNLLPRGLKPVPTLFSYYIGKEPIQILLYIFAACNCIYTFIVKLVVVVTKTISASSPLFIHLDFLFPTQQLGVVVKSSRI